MMSKHLPLCMACFVFLALCWNLPAASAADVDWRIDMREDGTIDELVSLPSEQVMSGGAGWDVKKIGNRYDYHRIVKDWQSYEDLEVRLPIQLEQKNYILYRTVEINADPSHASPFFTSLQSMIGLKLTLTTAGIVRQTTGQANGSSITWDYAKSSDLLRETELARIITVDGFLLGITILVLGLVGVFIYFVSGLRKVDRLIEEIYSLDNITREDLDEANPK